ncbi:alpha/beta fold hydrolase [Hymenobacter bucti]|uniref:Alpha/beta fold hydrolase n=1 Tax=Hymenobacter bucti TaxID=1844114 RepID=A0ABW4QZB5_9BACT
MAALILLVNAAALAGPASHLLNEQRAPLPPGPLAFRTSDSVQLFVKIAGRGVPCVVVHGGPGAGSYGLEHLGLQPLESSLQLIYLDQRGSGRSASSPRRAYALARQVQDLEELRIRLGLRQWVLLAHSFGGVIATAYAQRYPERVQALVLVNAVLDPVASLESMVHYGDSLLPAAARPPLPPTAPLPQRLGAVLQALGQQKRLYQLQYAFDTAAARASRMVQPQPGNRDFAAHVFDFPDYGRDYAPATAALGMPTLVLAGHDDYTAGPRAYRAFRFPRQRVLVLPGRHNLLQEQPALAQQAIRTFVAALPRRR